MKNFFLLIVLYFSVSFAADLYIQPGAVATTGCTITNPCSTFAQAIAAASSGDTIKAHPGTYTVGHNYSQSSWGVPITGKNLTIISLAGQKSTFITYGAFYLVDSVNLHFQGFTFKNYYFLADVSGMIVYNYLFRVDTNSHLYVQDVTVESGFFGLANILNQAALFTSPLVASQSTMRLHNVVVMKSQLYYLNYVGAIVYSKSQVYITNCKFMYNTGWIVRPESPATFFINDTWFLDNSFSSISFPGGAGGATLHLYRNMFHTPAFEQVIACTSATNVAAAVNNTFCGKSMNVSTCNGFTTPRMLEPADGCGVCGGDNSFKDCNGECLGSNTNCTQPPTLYVAPGGTGTGTKASPLGTIQAAINAAPNYSQIILLNGTYTGPGNVNLTFSGKRVRLTSLYKTNCDAVIDCENSPFTYPFRAISDENFDTNVDSITVTRCTFPIMIQNRAGMSFTNVKFTRNMYSSFDDSGVIKVNGGYLLVDKSEFSHNQGFRTAGIHSMYNAVNTSGVVIQNSMFLNNIGQRVYEGVGVFLEQNTYGKLISNVFVNNSHINNQIHYQLSLYSGIMLIMHNNSFFAEIASTRQIQCETQGLYPFIESGSTFCGPYHSVFCNFLSSPNVNTSADTCKVCLGHPLYNVAKDCKGSCFGTCDKNDTFGGCCRKSSRDCLGQCPLPNGNLFHTIDSNNTCCPASDVHCSLCYARCCEPSCVNGGVCDLANYPSNCNCNNTSGYFGSTCANFTCTSPCVHGTCVAPDTCSCVGGYFGPTCADFICTNECANGGSCVGPNTCSCVGGYFGQNCTEFSCAPSCKNGGVCVAPSTCDCSETLYTGNICQLCGEIECLHDGICTQIENENNETSLVCNCTGGYFGVDCSNFSCTNACVHGTCVAPDTCSCIAGFFGPTCNETCTNGCAHGGSCVGAETCNCTGTGYSGPTCNVPVCNPNCYYGGTCIGPDTCECPLYYGGQFCEVTPEGVIGEPSESNENAVVTRTAGIIIGVVFGVIGVAAIVLVVFFIVFYISKKRERSKPQIQAFQLQVSLNYPSEGLDTQDSYKH